MSSYRNGEATGLTASHVDDTGRMVASREAIAAWSRRHPNQVRRWCEPVACAVGTRAFMYDAEASVELLAARRRRGT